MPERSPRQYPGTREGWQESLVPGTRSCLTVFRCLPPSAAFQNCNFLVGNSLKRTGGIPRGRRSLLDNLVTVFPFVFYLLDDDKRFRTAAVEYVE